MENDNKDFISECAEDIFKTLKLLDVIITGSLATYDEYNAENWKEIYLAVTSLYLKDKDFEAADKIVEKIANKFKNQKKE